MFFGQDGKYLGNLSANRYDPDSINNPYGVYGSRHAADGVNNRYSENGSPYGANSATNRFAAQAPRIVDPCTGKELGELSANPYAPDSTANPYGIHGSRYSPDSINNPYGPYGRRSALPSAYPLSGLDPLIPMGIVTPRARGGIDASIPLRAVTPSARPNLFDTLGQLARLRALQLENQRRALDLQLENSQRALDLEILKAVMLATSAGTPPSATAPPSASTARPSAAPTKSSPGTSATPSAFIPPAGNYTAPPVVGTGAKPAPTATARPASPATSVGRIGLPDVTGYSAAKVQATLGPPQTQQSARSGLQTWTYSTPTGFQSIYIVDGIASMTRPQTRSRQSASASPAVEHSAVGACGISMPRAVRVARANAPIYVTPRIRPEPVAMLDAGAALPVMRAEGEWYAVQFTDRRAGTRFGYIHCSNVLLE